MQLFQINISRAQLMKMPRSERNIFLQSCHIANELNVLGKLVICAYFKGSTVESLAQLGMLLTLTRTCFAKAWEGWKFVRKTLLTTSGAPKPELDLDQKTVEELEKLKAAFDGDRIFRFLRDKVSFHYDAGQMGAVLEGLPADFESMIYLGGKPAYCLYFLPEEMLLRHLQRELKTSTLQETLDALGERLHQVLGPLTLVIGHGLMLLAKRHLAGENGLVPSQPVEIELKPIQDLRIPYFAEQKYFRAASSGADAPTQ